MKLTPLDIHHKKFHRALRGYNEEQVDKFLDEVTEEFERLFKDNIDLKEQVEKAKEKATQLDNLQMTLQNALITAQKSADDAVAAAKKEAGRMLQEAEAKAREMLVEAGQGREKFEEKFADLKNAAEDFRGQFRTMLESYMRLVEDETTKPETEYELPGQTEEDQAVPAYTEEAPAAPTTADVIEEAAFEKTGEAAYGFEGETSYPQVEEETLSESDEGRSSEEPSGSAQEPEAFNAFEPSAGGAGGAINETAPTATEQSFFKPVEDYVGGSDAAAPVDFHPNLGANAGAVDVATSEEGISYPTLEENEENEENEEKITRPDWLNREDDQEGSKE